MEPSKNTMMQFYQHLGKIFYCVAAADKTVREEELKQLKQILKTEWLPLDNSFDEYGTDSAYQIEIVFDWLMENDWDAEMVIPDFHNFMHEHESLFTEKVKLLILKTTSVIAESFQGKNKSELGFISQLYTIFSKYNKIV